MNIQEKLLYIQQNLKAPKSQYNKFGDFHYRSCEDIQEAVKPILKDVKAVLLIGDEIIQIGNRFYIKATAALQDVESSERITNTAFARETDEKPKMDAAQITGSCSNYARKYALNALFCIDDAKDPDYPAEPDRKKPAGRTARQQSAKQPEVTREELELLRQEADRTGTYLSTVCARYKVATIEKLNREQYLRAMSAFKKMDTVQQDDGFTDVDMTAEMPFR